MSRVDCQHSQTSYVVLQNSFQQEWAFVQRVTPGIGMVFQAVEYELQDTFLPDLFQSATSQIPGKLITSLPVKKFGINLPDPTQTTEANCTASCVIKGGANLHQK